MDRANETLVETETTKLVIDECAVGASPLQYESESQESGSQPAHQDEILSSSADIEAAAYFQLLGLATSKGAVSINRQESIFWLAKRFFFSSAIVILTGVFSLACLVIWMQLFFFILRWIPPGKLGASIELLARALATWVLCDQTVFNYAILATTAVITLIGWTCLHTLRNPILGWARYPWAAMQVVGGLLFIPIPNLAYVLISPAPEAVFAGRRLLGRILDSCIAKIAGTVHPHLRSRDRLIAFSAIWFPLCLGFLLFISMQGGGWLTGLLIALTTVLGVTSLVEFCWHRKITAGIDGQCSALWLELPVRTNRGKDPTLTITLPSGKRKKYSVHFGAQNTPLEMEQLPDTEDWTAPILFDECSARPVAIKLGSEIFPVSRLFWGL